MNGNAIRQEIAERLADLGLEGYAELPGQPEFPCAIVDLPEVTAFHSDMAHSITTVEVGVRVFVGRGEMIDAQRELGDYISTDTPESVLVALEAKPNPSAWARLKVERTSSLLNEGDALGVAFTLTIDA